MPSHGLSKDTSFCSSASSIYTGCRSDPDSVVKQPPGFLHCVTRSPPANCTPTHPHLVSFGRVGVVHALVPLVTARLKPPFPHAAEAGEGHSKVSTMPAAPLSIQTCRQVTAPHHTIDREVWENKLLRPLMGRTSFSGMLSDRTTSGLSKIKENACCILGPGHSYAPGTSH